MSFSWDGEYIPDDDLLRRTREQFKDTRTRSMQETHREFVIRNGSLWIEYDYREPDFVCTYSYHPPSVWYGYCDFMAAHGRVEPAGRAETRLR